MKPERELYERVKEKYPAKYREWWEEIKLDDGRQAFIIARYYGCIPGIVLNTKGFQEIIYVPETDEIGVLKPRLI